MMKRRVFLGDLALTGASLIVGCADGTAVYDAKPPGTTLDAGAPPVPDEAGAIDTGLGVPLRVDFDHDWRFLLEDAPSAADSDFDDADWEMVTLPHTARVEALVTGYPTSAEKQWQGYCWYRKRLRWARRQRIGRSGCASRGP